LSDVNDVESALKANVVQQVGAEKSGIKNVDHKVSAPQLLLVSISQYTFPQFMLFAISYIKQVG